MSNKCYNFKLAKSYNVDECLFDYIVDATYIIHLENNGRYESVMEQIKRFNICKKIYILFNKGFKKCRKPKHIVSSVEDLTHSYIQIFNHAESFRYNNILILEDDFMFSPTVKKHIRNIEQFFDEHNGKNFVYSLGSVPFIMIPYMKNHYKLYNSIGTHAIIYTKNSRRQILNDQNKIVDIDGYRNSNLTSYTYYKPLCYQLFPITENSKNWGKKEGWISQFIAKQVVFKLLIYNEMDKKVEPGYSRYYMYSKIIFYVIIFLCVYIAYRILQRAIKINIR
jgi:hypothetical protein